MAMKTIILLCLFISSCLSQFSAAVNKKVCLYSSASSNVLTPLQLTTANCNKNTTHCMNGLYKYSNYQYTGPSSLKPVRGEVAMFLSQDVNGVIDFVSFLNADVMTTMSVAVQITGADPVPIILKDDPDDTWSWDMSQNKGTFRWTTQPAFTDGVIIGHINFVDNYCIRSSYTQQGGTGVAINKLSVFTGTVAKPSRIISVSYTPGSTFEFCQYPQTATTYRNATCPNINDGAANVTIVFGPATSTFTWYNNAGTVIAPNSQRVTGLAPGIYHVVVNDTSTSMGCMAERTVEISAPFLYQPSVSTKPFNCSVKGSATVVPNGGSGGFTYQWKSGSNVIGTGSSIANLEIGSYSVCVTDSCNSNQCTAFTIATAGCCGDGICQANEVCGSAGSCPADCGVCCQPGFKKVGSTCQVCPPGSRSTTYQATDCDSCPENTFNAGGALPCTTCPDNEYSAAGSDKCEPCPPGTVRPAGQASCQSCGDGKYADPCGNGCVDAAGGTFAVDGAWTASSCAPGYFAASGASSCSPCPKNTYSAGKSSSCTACPGSTATVGTGATHALFCA